LHAGRYISRSVVATVGLKNGSAVVCARRALEDERPAGVEVRSGR
jgi:hypothetical protein